MRRALKLIVLIGALLGLFGQPVAMAGGVSPHSMSSDCMGMMGEGGKGAPPCEKMTLACIAGVGCGTSFAVEGRAATIEERTPAALPAAPLPVSTMTGRSVSPELHPPSSTD